MGRLIPAGTGLAGYRNLNIEVDETGLLEADSAGDTPAELA